MSESNFDQRFGSDSSSHASWGRPGHQSAQDSQRTFGAPAEQVVDFVPAGFWIRLIAYLVDYLILSIICVLPFFGIKEGFLNNSAASMIIPGAIAIFLGTVGALAYFSFFEGICGASPGKMLLNLKVLSASDLQYPSVARALGRRLAHILSSIFFCLGYIWIAFDAEKKGWHDHIAGCRVVSIGTSWLRIFGSLAGVIGLYIAYSAISAMLIGDPSKILESLKTRAQQHSATAASGTGSSGSFQYPARVAAPEPIVIPDPELAQSSRSALLSEPASAKRAIRVPSAQAQQYAVVGDMRVDFPSVVAVLDEDDEILNLHFFSKKLGAAEIDAVRLNGRTSATIPDLSFEMRFAGRYEVRYLTSYVARFNKNSAGFALPVAGPSVEFARAQTWGRGREVVGLSEDVTPGKDLSIILKGEATAWKDKTTPVIFTWDIAASTPLLSVRRIGKLKRVSP